VDIDENVDMDEEQINTSTLFKVEDVTNATKCSNFNKGLGPDCFDGNALKKDGDLNDKLMVEITDALNSANLPEYLRIGRLVPLQKSASKGPVALDDIRPIVVRSHVSKIMEKAILEKINATCPHVITSKVYQTGFKEGKSTAIHASRLLHEVHGRKKRRFNLLVDLQKAYDSVDRQILWSLLRARCKNQQEKSLIELIVKLHNESTIQVGMYNINAEMGLPQGSVLSPVLFNVYLEEALKSSVKLEAVRRRGDLLAFADDMLVMTDNQNELAMIIDELSKLEEQWNLRLNKKKSEILTKEKVQEVGGVRCVKVVKYLGVKVTCDRQE
jgi:hypothetical protein